MELNPVEPRIIPVKTGCLDRQRRHLAASIGHSLQCIHQAAIGFPSLKSRQPSLGNLFGLAQGRQLLGGARRWRFKG